MTSKICQAIQENRIIEFHYDGHYRKVESYCHGTSKRGKESVRGYQVAGGSNSRNIPLWRLFTIAKIGDLSLTDETFQGNRPAYNPNDKDLRVHCNI